MTDPMTTPNPSPQPTPSEKSNDLAAFALYKAVAKYIKHRGGEVIVAGGIQIQEWPGDTKCNFSVAVKCTGRKPNFATQEKR